jgi:transposase
LNEAFHSIILSSNPIRLHYVTTEDLKDYLNLTAILDQGWSEFRRQLDYKQAWNGGVLIAVPPQHTSQTCPACRQFSRDNRKTQAEFACVQ